MHALVFALAVLLIALLFLAIHLWHKRNDWADATELDNDQPPHAYDPEAYEAHAIATEQAHRAAADMASRFLPEDPAIAVRPASLTGLVGLRALGGRDGAEL